MRIYCLSGLGTDRRMYSRLRFPQGAEVVHLDWIPPHAGETLEAYAARMAAFVDDSRPFALVGLSLGGMVAVEIARLRKPVTTVLISSICHAGEFPFFYRVIAGKLRLHRRLPTGLIKTPTPFTYWIFGARSPEVKALLRQIIVTNPPHFFRWAVDAILKWKNHTRPANLFHIHGSADRVLYCANTRADVIIPGGGHLMILEQAPEVEKHLNRHLQASFTAG